MIRGGCGRRAKLRGYQKNFVRLLVEGHGPRTHLRGNILDDTEFVRRIFVYDR